MTNQEYKKMWVVEWSEVQKEFHIDTLSTAVEASIDDYFLKKASDWRILAIVNTNEEATRLCEKIKEKRASNGQE